MLVLGGEGSSWDEMGMCCDKMKTCKLELKIRSRNRSRTRTQT